MYESMTPEAIKAEILKSIEQSHGISSMAGSFADGVVGPVSEKLSEFIMALDAVPSMLFVDEDSGGYIDLVGKQYFNITRRSGTRAYCDITFTGVPGLVIPQNTVFLTAGGLSFSLLSPVALDDEGAGKGRLEAAEEGSVYNVDALAINRMYITLAGLNSYTNAAASGGTDPESDAALLTRIQERVQRPPTSGNGYQYRQWALEVAGVGNAKIVGLAFGPGTVGVTLVDSNYEAAAEPIVEAVTTNIDSQRPIGPSVTVAAAVELPVTVTAKVTLTQGTDVSAVLETFQATLMAHLHGLIDDKYTHVYYKAADDVSYTLLYNRVLAMLLTIKGVEDVTSLSVNGGTANVTIAPDQIPVLGEVSIT